MSNDLSSALRRAADSWNKDKSIRWEYPGDLAATVNPKTVVTPALTMVDQALKKVYETPDARLIISIAPQEGKSVRVAGDFPAWWLAQRPDARIVMASYSSALAARNGRQIRQRIQNNDLGIQIADDNGSVHDWTLKGHDGGVLSVGVGSGLTGRPADAMIIDDPIKDRKEADSETFRENVWSWWTDTASSRLAPGAPVVLILTRWHHDDLAGRLLKSDASQDEENPDAVAQDTYDEYDPDKPLIPHRWTLLNIPARADHDPLKGETDILGRVPGEYMVSARRRTPEQWQARERAAGPYTWASLYQGKPTPGAGDMFPKEWSRYDHPLHVEMPNGTCIVPGAHEVVQSWDMTFKDTAGSDFVVCQIWARFGTDAYLVDMIRRRMAFNATKEAFLAMTAKWPQAIAKFVEDKANGPAVINALQRTVPGIIPIEPEGSKMARAAAVSPFAHSGNVILPTAEILPNVTHMILEAEQFPAGAHDDTIDAYSQAINRILLHPLIDPKDEYQTLEDMFGDNGGTDPHAILGGY